MGLPAGGGDDDDEEDDGHHHPDDRHHLHVLPPVLPLQPGRLGKIVPWSFQVSPKYLPSICQVFAT